MENSRHCTPSHMPSWTALVKRAISMLTFSTGYFIKEIQNISPGVPISYRNTCGRSLGEHEIALFKFSFSQTSTRVSITFPLVIARDLLEDKHIHRSRQIHVRSRQLTSLFCLFQCPKNPARVYAYLRRKTFGFHHLFSRSQKLHRKVDI